MNQLSLIAVRIVSSLLMLVAVSAHAGDAKAVHKATQLLVVTTAEWNDVQGTMQRYERSHSGGKWNAVGTPIAVVVGKNGLGWGSGIDLTDMVDLRLPGDPVKREGDGKAPAGVFQLGNAFGYASTGQPGWKMPYISLTPSIECVDDTSSKFYNRVVDGGAVSRDWKSSEHMRREDELYRWGVVVDHNADPPRAGEGSCIFLHIWRGPAQGTVGCTAMPREQLESVLAWLDPARKPLLVQAPAAQYKQLKQRLHLP